MRKQKSGHIVGISTVLVDQPLACARISLPVPTKSAIPEFNRALAMELVSDGIRANTISPSVVDTPIPAKDDHEILKKPQLLVRISQIVDALLYLESASMVNGENIRIGGGAQKSFQTERHVTTHPLHQIFEARSFFAASTMFARAWRVSVQPRVFKPQSGLTHRRS
jgi:hypothetical protein